MHFSNHILSYSVWFFSLYSKVFIGINPFFQTVSAQENFEQSPPDFIKSIVFKSSNPEIQFPILENGSLFVLEFDDLQAIDADYYYKITYFDHDWTSSNLFKNEYLQGFDNLRIEDFRSSTNTLQRYTHYRLQLPNEDTQFLLSGNYLLSIYDSDDALVFSRRFLVLEKEAEVAVGIFRTRSLDYFNTHQSVQFSITPKETAFRDPERQLKVVVIQNENWNTFISTLKPQYFNSTSLEYRYDEQSRFPGGNEFLFFDTKDLRVSSPSVSFVERTDRYDSFLYTDILRANLPYTLFPDINGDFEIRTVQGTQDEAIEADYTRVHFSLSALAEIPNTQVYVVGKFNNYELDENSRMIYNQGLNAYEASLLLKQGFYNYSYVVESEQGIDPNAIGGNFAQTENRYLVLVYYRNFGDLNDRLIGVGSGSSFQLLN